MPRRPAIPGSVPITAPIDHRAMMQLGRASAPFKDPAWTWEVKFDGYRMLAFRGAAGARLLSRNGRESGAQFPEIVAALTQLQVECVLDCELTIPDERGRPDWHALGPRTAMRRPLSILQAMKARPARLYVFDVLAIGKLDLRGATLRDRRIALQELLIGAPPAIVLSEQWADGPALYRSVVQHELEGIVGKKLDSK